MVTMCVCNVNITSFQWKDVFSHIYTGRRSVFQIMSSQSLRVTAHYVNRERQGDKGMKELQERKNADDEERY